MDGYDQMTATPETEDSSATDARSEDLAGVPYCERHDMWHSASCESMDAVNSDLRTDREILLNIETLMLQIRDLTAAIGEEASPIIDQITGHKMFRLMFGTVKND
jgi:hypothetical protein